MKHKFILTGSAVIAVASICVVQPLRAAENDEQKEEQKTEQKDEQKTEKKEAKSSAKSTKSSVSSADKKFVENAAKGGMMEVAWGRAATSRANNNDVKQFGARMVNDHSKANNELKAIASRKGISIPKDDSSVNYKTDADYMSMMVKDHEKDLSEFQQEARSGSDPDLKKFADKTAKIVSSHLTEARRINKALKRETSSLAR